MFNSKTLFVVGAGASAELGLPTGTELKRLIAHTVDLRFEDFQRQTHGDKLIFQALRKHLSLFPNQSGVAPYQNAGRQIKEAMPLAPSIDNFIDVHRHDDRIALMGKLAITRCILRAERSSSIFIKPEDDQKLNFSNLTGVWLSSFFRWQVNQYLDLMS